MKALICLVLLIVGNFAYAKNDEPGTRECSKVMYSEYSDHLGRSSAFVYKWNSETCNQEDIAQYWVCKRRITSDCNGIQRTVTSEVILSENIKVVKITDIDTQSIIACGHLLSTRFDCSKASYVDEANYTVAKINNFQIPSPTSNNVSRAPAIEEVERDIATKVDEVESEEGEQNEARQE